MQFTEFSAAETGVSLGTSETVAYRIDVILYGLSTSCYCSESIDQRRIEFPSTDLQAAGVRLKADLSGAYALLFDNAAQSFLALNVDFANSLSVQVQALNGVGTGLVLASQGFFHGTQWVIAAHTNYFGATSYSHSHGFFFPLDTSQLCSASLTSAPYTHAIQYLNVVAT